MTPPFTLAARCAVRALRTLSPGALACAVAAAAASFLSGHYGAPVMLFALLLGLAMNFLAEAGPCRPGIEFTARSVLRCGVALLGLRIGFDPVMALGWPPVLLVLGSVLATIGVGVIAALALGFRGFFGLLTGGAVAICGASAALALSAALPQRPLKERATLFTVIGVSALSTLVMLLYPMLAHGAGLDARAAGIFLGGSIHDVAQVVGAGYAMGTETGNVATLVKLLCVAMLLPVIVLAAALTRRQLAGAMQGEGGTGRPPLLPGFALAFALLVAANSLGWVPQPVQAFGNDAARGCLVSAIAAIGMKTQLKELATVGWRPIALMLGETAFLALLVLVLLKSALVPS